MSYGTGGIYTPSITVASSAIALSSFSLGKRSPIKTELLVEITY
nr:hypothetical protein [Okeania sp. SIO2F4]